MTDRITCCVPHCRRTRRNDVNFSEWICGPHWRLVSKRAKLFKRRVDAAYRAAEAECEAIGHEGYLCALAHNGGIESSIMDRFGLASDRRHRKSLQASRAWQRCKREAIERAAGI